MNEFNNNASFIEHLEPLDVIGNGTFGIVYLCNDKCLHKHVALKKLFWNSSPLLIYNEIESLMTFTQNNCRNVPKLINLYRSKDMVFIEMEYHQHQSINTYLYKMNNDDIVQYMKELLVALCDIHSLGYIHCDVKPGNFLFDFETKTGYLCDFGLCEKRSHISQNLILKPLKSNYTKIDNDDGNEYHEKQFIIDPIKFNFDNLERDIKIESNFVTYKNEPQESYQIIRQDSQSCTIHFDIPLTSDECYDKGLNEQQNYLSNRYQNTQNNFTHANEQQKRDQNDSYYSMEEYDSRDTMRARRAGTRGYRAPEVLWKMENQTSAIDIWSAGIIFLSLLSKRQPFLSGKDDLTDLYEISCIVGRKRIQFEALMCGRFLALPDNGQESIPLKEIVEKLNPFINEMNVPDSAFDLLERMLEPSPFKRISAKRCLQHPYLNNK